MKFEYIVGRYQKNVKRKDNMLGSVLAGFANLEAAEEYAEWIERNYLDDGFMFIYNDKEGYYIEGYEDTEGENLRWFRISTERDCLIYDVKSGLTVEIASYLSKEEYDLLMKTPYIE